MARVLISGFESFGGERVNPAQEVVRALAARPVSGVEVTAVELPVVFATGFSHLRAAVEEADPDLVLMLGQAGGRAAVTVERVAVNLDDADCPDNAGEQPVDRPIVPDGPAAYFARLPVRRLVDEMRAAGVPAEVSGSAGGHLCNHVFYRVMHLGEHQRPGLRGGFVHLPYLPEQVLHKDAPSMSLDIQCRAVEIAIRTVVTAL